MGQSSVLVFACSWCRGGEGSCGNHLVFLQVLDPLHAFLRGAVELAVQHRESLGDEWPDGHFYRHFDSVPISVTLADLKD